MVSSCTQSYFIRFYSFSQLLQSGKSISVYHRIQFYLILAEFTLIGSVTDVIRHILLVKDCVDLHPRNLRDVAENCRDAGNFSAVIQDTVHTSLQSFTSCRRCHQDQHVLILNHHLQIIPEDYLPHTA